MLHDIKQRLKRVHVGSVLGVLAALYIAFYLVQTVQRNYQLQRQLADMQAQLANLQNDRDALRYKIQYYQTDSYKEKEARAKLGLQAPGEGVVILPHKDAPPQPSDAKKKTASTKSNWQQWVDFLEGKSS